MRTVSWALGGGGEEPPKLGRRAGAGAQLTATMNQS